MKDALADLDATALAELVRKKEVTPLELVESAIARIERLNPELNAVVTTLYDQARAAASKPLPDGPFTGVPFLVKDILATVEGARHTMGSRLMSHVRALYDTELVKRHRRAGLVIVGITNTPEYGIVPTTEPLLHGATRNPWDPTRSCGGSSGGSAVAVASGMVSLAHANDGGGSIRIPASCCGVFGLKPTRARNPTGPDVGDILHGFGVEHAVSRSVRDSAALLDATEGADPGAPYHAPPKARPYVEEVKTPPGRLRIGLVAKPMSGVAVDPECAAALADAARLCGELGHDVVEVTPAIDGAMVSEAFVTLWVGGCAFAVDEVARRIGKKPNPDELEPLTWAIYEMGKNVPLSRYLGALARLQWVSRRIAEQFEAVDLWMSPTVASPPLPLGSFDPAPGNAMAGLFRAAEFAPFTPLANATGQPAMSVPLAWSRGGLPIGIHFVARFGDEATLFRLAAQLEAARPWRDRWPGGGPAGPAGRGGGAGAQPPARKVHA